MLQNNIDEAYNCQKYHQIYITGMADRSTSTGRSQRSRQSQSRSQSDGSGKQCILCGRIEKYMTRFVHWGDNEKQFVVRHLCSQPPDESYVCKRHQLEAKRHHPTFPSGRILILNQVQCTHVAIQSVPYRRS